MAKCVKHTKTGKIERVPNDKAQDKVDSGKYEYCPKSEYKKQMNLNKEE